MTSLQQNYYKNQQNFIFMFALCFLAQKFKSFLVAWKNYVNFVNKDYDYESKFSGLVSLP